MPLPTTYALRALSFCSGNDRVCLFITRWIFDFIPWTTITELKEVECGIDRYQGSINSLSLDFSVYRNLKGVIGSEVVSCPTLARSLLRRTAATGRGDGNGPRSEGAVGGYESRLRGKL